MSLEKDCLEHDGDPSDRIKTTNNKNMKKSKRQRQVDLLERLLDRVNTSVGIKSSSVIQQHIDWIHKKMSQAQGGDIELDSGGLSMDDMLHANVIWRKFETKQQ